MNKITKDLIVYTHPVIGQVSFSDILAMLKYIANQTQKFENITLDMLENLVSKDAIISLYPLLNSSLLHEIIDDLENYINQ